jgi:hypothetical protein
MKVTLFWAALLAPALAVTMAAAQKPRIFVTESTAAQASGDAAVGDAKGSLAFTGGTSPQNVEVMKAFVRYCPAVIVTANREKADYIVRLDHDPISPTTPFVHGNKVAVFNKSEDLMYSNSTRILSSAVKGACAVISGGSASPDGSVQTHCQATNDAPASHQQGQAELQARHTAQSAERKAAWGKASGAECAGSAQVFSELNRCWSAQATLQGASRPVTRLPVLRCASPHWCL